MMMGLLVGYVFFGLLLYAGPALGGFFHLRRLGARDGSLLARASALAKVRAGAVGAMLLIYLALAILFFAAPDSEPALPGHQYSAAFEAWRGVAVTASLAATLLGVAADLVVVGVLIGDVSLFFRALRSRTWVRAASPTEPLPGATPDFDFGVGDEWWAKKETAGVGYRGSEAVAAWARGSPDLGRFLLGPIVSISTVLVSFACIGITMLMSLGD